MILFILKKLREFVEGSKLPLADLPAGDVGELGRPAYTTSVFLSANANRKKKNLCRFVVLRGAPKWKVPLRESVWSKSTYGFRKVPYFCS